MPVSVNKNLAASYILEDPLGRIANDGRIANLGRVGLKGYNDLRWAYNFDGVDDYGVLANRAINPDGDIDIEFYTPTLSGLKTIIYQGAGETDVNQQDLWLLRNGSNIELRVGGAARGLGSLAANEKFRITLVGTSLNVFNSSGTNILSSAYTRGAYRSSNPVTVIGARLSSSSYVNYFQGLLYNIRINGVLWAMDQRNQAIQPSTPAGNNMTLVNTTSDRWIEVPQ